MRESLGQDEYGSANPCDPDDLPNPSPDKNPHPDASRT